MVRELDDPTLRELSVYKYRLLYRVREDRVVIRAFLHGARDFSAWRQGQTPDLWATQALHSGKAPLRAFYLPTRCGASFSFSQMCSMSSVSGSNVNDQVVPHGFTYALGSSMVN